MPFLTLVQNYRVDLLNFFCRVNERRYEFGNATAAADPNMAWVCSKVIKYSIKIAYKTTD